MSLNTTLRQRRQSAHLRTRPRTAGADSSRRFSVFEAGPYRETLLLLSHNEPVPPLPEDSARDLSSTYDAQRSELSPGLIPQRRGSRTSAGFRHGVNGFRAAVRRLSMSFKPKQSKAVSETPHYECDRDSDVDGERHGRGRGGARPAENQNELGLSRSSSPQPGGSSRPAWFRRERLSRHKSFSSLSVLRESLVGLPVSILPGRDSGVPPLPEDAIRFAAIAAAAEAAQNEEISLKVPVSHCEEVQDDGNLEVKPSLDSESGIEINIEGPSDGSLDEPEPKVVRKDPVLALPAELIMHVLAFLDADSLKNAELVSRAWHAQASSRHVWREVFRNEYQRRPASSRDTHSQPKSLGLGKVRPNQDWKKMLGVRRLLENRWKQGKAAAVYLHGHKDTVYCVQFDENKILTGSRDRTVRIWDAKFPWPCLKVLGVPEDPEEPAPFMPLAAATSPDYNGQLPFISICPNPCPANDLMSKIARDANQEDDFIHTGSVLCLQYDDETLVTGSSDHTCIVWDIKNDYKPIRRLKGHRAGVLDVCFDDRYIVTCSKDTTIFVWDRHTGELVKKLLGHGGPVNAVQLRGDLVVSASGNGIAKLWNITSGLCIKEFSSRDRGLACIEFSDDARTILAGGNDMVIYQFDANTGELVNEFEGHTGLVRSLYMDSANERIISSSYDGSVKVFDIKTGDLSIDFPNWTTSWMLSAKSDYRRIVATSQDSRAVIMDFGYGLDGIDLLRE